MSSLRSANPFLPLLDFIACKFSWLVMIFSCISVACNSEISLVITALSLIVKILEITLYAMLQRLIGLKCSMQEGFSIFGIKTRKLRFN